MAGASHFWPMLPMISGAQQRGAEVLVVGPTSLREAVEATGFDFAGGDEPEDSDVVRIRNRLPTSPPEEAAVLANRELFGRLATSAMLPAMERVFAAWKPDLVLREPCEYASGVLAGRTDTSIAQIAVSLAQVEDGSIRVAEPVLEEHHRGLAEGLRTMRYLSRFPPSIDPSPFPHTIRYREERLGPPGALGNWWSDSTRPLIYVTFGTVLGYMEDAGAVYRAAVRAVGDLDVRVLLTVGRKFDPAELGSIPSNVHVEPFVEQHDVFEQAQLVVCHGGSGTVLGALGAGVPIVAVPLFADQFANSEQLVAVGAAVPARRLDERFPIGDEAVRPIREAIVTALATASYAAAARQISTEIAGLPRADDVIDKLIAGVA